MPTFDGNTYTTTAYTIDTNWNKNFYGIDTYVKESELDCKMEELIRKIYNAIKETARLDIDENDFVKIIQG